MWGDFVGSSLLTDEDFKRLASELESGRVSVNQVRAAVLEAEIGRCLDDDMYSAFLDKSCSSCPYNEKIYADDRLYETICLNKSCPVWLNGHPGDVGKRFEKTTVAEWNEKAKKQSDAQSSTTAIPKSSLPERFIVHWCEKKRFCICDLIGWEVK